MLYYTSHTTHSLNADWEKIIQARSDGWVVSTLALGMEGCMFKSHIRQIGFFFSSFKMDAMFIYSFSIIHFQSHHEFNRVSWKMAIIIFAIEPLDFNQYVTLLYDYTQLSTNFICYLWMHVIEFKQSLLCSICVMEFKHQLPLLCLYIVHKRQRMFQFHVV